MHVYPVPPRAASSITDEGEVPGDGPLMVAVRAADLVFPAGRPLGEHDRPALAVGGTARIRTGEPATAQAAGAPPVPGHTQRGET